MLKTCLDTSWFLFEAGISLVFLTISVQAAPFRHMSDSYLAIRKSGMGRRQNLLGA